MNGIIQIRYSDKNDAGYTRNSYKFYKCDQWYGLLNFFKKELNLS